MHCIHKCQWRRESVYLYSIFTALSVPSNSGRTQSSVVAWSCWPLESSRTSGLCQRRPDETTEAADCQMKIGMAPTDTSTGSFWVCRSTPAYLRRAVYAWTVSQELWRSPWYDVKLLVNDAAVQRRCLCLRSRCWRRLSWSHQCWKVD